MNTKILLKRVKSIENLIDFTTSTVVLQTLHETLQKEYNLTTNLEQKDVLEQLCLRIELKEITSRINKL